MRPSRAVIKLLDRNNKVVDARSVRAVVPFAAVSDAVHFVV